MTQKSMRAWRTWRQRSWQALTCWLWLFELAGYLLRWEGLCWGSPVWLAGRLSRLYHTGRSLRRHGQAGWVALLLCLLPAVLVQGLLASLRNWRLNPRHRLRSGNYRDRQITRMDVPTRHGAVPALLVVPASNAQAVVCMLHGSGSDKYFYTWDSTDSLIASGFAVLLVDLEGHGESPRPQRFPHGIETVQDCVGWLRSRYKHVALFGISLGGCVAVRATAEAAACSVDALVVLASPVRLRLSRWHIFREAIGLVRPAVLRQLRVGSPYHLIRAWTTTPRVRATIGTVRLIDTLHLTGSLQRLARQPQPPPLLLVYAAQDAIVPRQQARQVQQAAPAGSRFHLLPRASHLSLSIDPRMQRLVRDWLAAQFSLERHE